MNEPVLAEVLLFQGLDKPLSYKVPPELEGHLKPGCLVRVPLGGRFATGLVRQVGSTSTFELIKIKPIQSLIYPDPIISLDLLPLGQWLGQYYAATSVWESLIPSILREGKTCARESLFSLSEPFDEATHALLAKRSAKQAALYQALAKSETPKSLKHLEMQLGPCSSPLKALIQKNLVIESSQKKDKTAYRDIDFHLVNTKPPPLNTEQQAALSAIQSSLRIGAFKTHLLHGVTGSGKTEVYLGAIQEALDSGGSVIFLVPELVLTPQTVERVRSRFSHAHIKTLVWHSGLSEGERLDAWFSLLKGEAKIVVGARSAVLLPMKDLKLIIVDEEHDPAYKQEDNPRYNARDVAVYRAKLNHASVVLGSATPSLESLYNTRYKGYELNKLSQRVDDCKLPTMHLVDMRRELQKGSNTKTQILSKLLISKILDRFDKKEQSILFLNKRGYATSLLCTGCGHVATCKHCSVTLTYHKAQGSMRCHICAYSMPVVKNCPQCQELTVYWRGFGTQRIEDILAQLLPKARLARLDSDSLSQKDHFREVLAQFRLGKIDILLGTQMIAKGLDFPNVTLVGIIDADLSLHQQDFRSAERTFQLLVQVAGRAGRGKQLGEVVVQTFAPHTDAFQCARRSDFDGFLEHELNLRQEFHYPPFRHLIRHIFRSTSLEKLAFFTEKWSQALEKELGHIIELRGPSSAPIEKIKDHYRYHLWYFAKNVSQILPKIKALRRSFPFDASIHEALDVDPQSLI